MCGGECAPYQASAYKTEGTHVVVRRGALVLCVNHQPKGGARLVRVTGRRGVGVRRVVDGGAVVVVDSAVVVGGVPVISAISRTPTTGRRVVEVVVGAPEQTSAK